MVVDLEVEGVVEINGDIILDDTYFSDGPMIPGWRKKVDIANGPAYFVPVGALSLNHNALSIDGSCSRGIPCAAATGDAFGTGHLRQTVETVSAGKRGWVRIERDADPSTGETLFTVEGEVPHGSELQRHYRAVAEPRSWFASVFEDILESRQLKFTGRVVAGSTPADAEEVVRLWSPPLHEILNHTNKYSSNPWLSMSQGHGGRGEGRAGLCREGLDVVREYFDSLGIPRDEYAVINGSGLPDLHACGRAIWSVLMDMHHDPLLAPEFLSMLAVSGRDGTLRRRFDEEEETGRVRGKTGSLNGVYCLAAYVRSGAGDVYALTILVNNFRRTRPVRVLHDRFGEAMLALEERPGPVAADVDAVAPVVP